MLTLLISMLNWLNLMLGWLDSTLTWVYMLNAQGDLFLDKVFLLWVFLFNIIIFLWWKLVIVSLFFG